jgi:hypothetical protein
MDFLLLSPGVAARLHRAGVDVARRGRDKPSDHAPVWIELEEGILTSTPSTKKTRSDGAGYDI